VLEGSYPDDMRELYEELIGPLDFVRDGDLDVIHTPGGFIGVNYYARRLMRTVPGKEPYPWEVVTDSAIPHTDAGNEITPSAFTDLLLRLRADYGDVPMLVTENGADLREGPGADGRVRDDRRARFVYDHLAALHEAIGRGVPIRGYCHWSLMDNFEWALGYAPRFGLVHVDYGTQARTVKDSGRYYARIAAANALVPPS